MKIAWLGIILATALPVHADILEPTEGGQIRVPTTIDGDRVLLETPDGVVAFPRSDFRKIHSEPDPSRDWPQRKARALQAGASEKLACGLWALDHGLVPEAELMIREAHQSDPSHVLASKLNIVLDRLELSGDLSTALKLPNHLPKTLQTTRSRHFVLLHQHSHIDVAERLEVLERVNTAYYLTFAAMGFDLPVPSAPLLSIWFADRADYVAFLKAEGAAKFQGTRGYYYPSRHLIAAYDCRSDPDRLRNRRILDKKKARIETISSGESTRKLAREKIVMELERREIDLGVAAHETIHQLVDATKLAPSHESYPNWLSEGLAMQFESIANGRWAGLGEPSLLRLADYQQIDAPNLLATVRDSGFSRGYRPDVYARSWALTYDLRVHHPSEFAALLHRFHQNESRKQTREVYFEQTFSTSTERPLPEVESQWHAAMKALAATSPGLHSD